MEQRRETQKALGFGTKDLKILEHLAEFSTSHIGQINRDVFGNGDVSFAYRKMRRLIDYGMVEKRYFERSRKGNLAYVLSPKGLRGLELKGDKLKQINKFRPQSLLHDMELVDIAF